MNRRTFLRGLSALAALPLLGFRKPGEILPLTRETFAVPGWIVANRFCGRGVVTSCTLDGVDVIRDVWAANMITGEVVFHRPDNRKCFDEQGNPLGILRRGKVVVTYESESKGQPVELALSKKHLDEIADEVARRIVGNC